MLIISKQQLENLLDKLADSARLDESRRELEKMLEIKSALLGTVTEGLQPCCGTLCNIETDLDGEVQLLEEALDALNKGDVARASSLLKDYINYLERLETNRARR